MASASAIDTEALPQWINGGSGKIVTAGTPVTTHSHPTGREISFPAAAGAARIRIARCTNRKRGLNRPDGPGRTTDRWLGPHPHRTGPHHRGD
ncbi:hypothetical protein Ate01nite_53800 [Actinoplanes teichomyceticus]|nr:hypothetical protein Ate01nite_53800 [Actinoplanes teichomyceticus]